MTRGRKRFPQPFPSGDGKELLSRWSGEKSLTGMVIRNRKAMRFSKSEIRKLADDGAISTGARARSLARPPLLNRDNVFGAIFVQSYDDPKAYDDASMETLQIAANQISVYMEKKRCGGEAARERRDLPDVFEQTASDSSYWPRTGNGCASTTDFAR